MNLIVLFVYCVAVYGISYCDSNVLETNVALKY